MGECVNKSLFKKSSGETRQQRQKYIIQMIVPIAGFAFTFQQSCLNSNMEAATTEHNVIQWAASPSVCIPEDGETLIQAFFFHPPSQRKSGPKLMFQKPPQTVNFLRDACFFFLAESTKAVGSLQVRYSGRCPEPCI